MLQATIIYLFYGALLFIKGSRSDIVLHPKPIPSHCDEVTKNSGEEFNKTLLNRTILGFLEPCCSKTCCNSRDILCPVYFEIVSNLSHAYENKSEKRQITPELLSNIIESHESSTQFCKEFPKLLLRKLKLTEENCIIFCKDTVYQEDKIELVIKPICKIISWLLTNSPTLVPIERRNEIQPNLIQNKSSSISEIPISNDNHLLVKENIKEKNQTQNVATKEGYQIQNQDQKQNSINVIEEENNKVPISIKTTTVKVESTQEGKNQSKLLKEPSSKKEPLSGNIDEEVTKVSIGGKNNISSSGILKEDNTEKKLRDDVIIQTDNMSELVNQGNEDGMDQEDLAPKEEMDPEEDSDNDVLAQPDTKLVDDEPKMNDDINTVLDNSAILGNNERKHDAVIVAPDPFHQEEGSNFFTYFLIGMFSCIIMYIIYHNKSKILALLLEGRRSQKGRNGRRKHTAQYRKLDTNLEEAITSTASGRGSQIIY